VCVCFKARESESESLCVAHVPLRAPVAPNKAGRALSAQRPISRLKPTPAPLSLIAHEHVRLCLSSSQTQTRAPLSLLTQTRAPLTLIAPTPFPLETQGVDRALQLASEGERLIQVIFDFPQRAVAPGQVCSCPFCALPVRTCPVKLIRKFS